VEDAKRDVSKKNVSKKNTRNDDFLMWLPLWKQLQEGIGRTSNSYKRKLSKWIKKQLKTN
jgi:hypothetical protein